MREATAEELARWDELVESNPDGGNVLQSRAFGETKGRHGWRPRYMMLGKTAVLILSRSVPVLGEFWYVPKGPGVSDFGGIKSFTELIAKPHPFLIKIDPEIAKDEIEPRRLSGIGLTIGRDIQYNINTVIVDLELSEDEILASFKQKTRYNVRLAIKKGVQVEPVPTTDETISQLYDLAQMTYKRAGVYVRSKEYFGDFWRLHSEQGTGQMFFARLNGELLAAAYITHLGKKALYKDGASSREHSDAQAPYLLQWEVMKWLKGHGVDKYDLHGVPPADQLDNPKHPLAGLARFKTGFNQNITEFIGTWDLPLNKTGSVVWKVLGERLAQSYEARFNKRLFY